MNAQLKQSKTRVPYDSLTLRAVVHELGPLLVGGQIQQIRHPEPKEVILSVRSHGKNHSLLLSSDARFARVHLTEARKINSPKFSSFGAAMRHLLDGHIVSIAQRGFDRIFEMVVKCRSEDGTTSTFTLIAELMSKHSNLILIDERGKVLDAAKRVSHKINRFRETLPGQPYLPPPLQSGTNSPLLTRQALHELFAALGIEQMDRVSVRKILTDQFEGISPFLADELVWRAGLISGEPISTDALAEAWAQTLLCAAHNLYEPVQVNLEGGLYAYPFSPLHLQAPMESASSLNASLDIAYKEIVRTADLDSAVTELAGRLDREQRRLEKQRTDAERTQAEGERAEDYRRQGDLLLANLWKVEAGTKSVAVQDFYAEDQAERAIALDPKLTPHANAEAYFRKARKATNAQELAVKRHADVKVSLQELNNVLKQFIAVRSRPEVTASDILGYQRQLLGEGTLREDAGEAEAKPSDVDFQGHRIRRFLTAENYEILWGESATANDFLTTRVAALNDMWLHVRSSTGSHVVIRSKGQPDKIPPAVLHRAARIAALHSSQKHSSLVPVDYTIKKYVRKPRGSEPGSVEIQREKTLHVNPLEDGDRE